MTDSIRLDTRELDRLIKELGGKKEAALMAIATEIKQDAAFLAPYKTGALSNSITTEKVDENRARVGPTVDYGIYLELGTHNMKPRKFLWPAVESVIGKLNNGEYTKDLLK